MTSLPAARLVDGECDRANVSHVESLLIRHSQVEAKKEERRVQAKQEEVSGCTFQPRCSPRRNSIEGETRGASRAEALYARAFVDKERREARAQESARARSDAEVKGCTFRPDTAKSGRSYHKAQDAAPVPRGFYETRERLRNAGEAERLKRQQREDRMARIGCVGGSTSNMGGAAPATAQQEVAPTAQSHTTTAGQGDAHGAFVADESTLNGGASTAENYLGRSGSLGRSRSASATVQPPPLLEEELPPPALDEQHDWPAPQGQVPPGQEELQMPLHRTPSNPKHAVPPLLPQPAEHRAEPRAEPQTSQRAEPRVEPRAASSPRLAAVLGRQRPPKGSTSVSPSRSGNLQQAAGRQQQPGRPVQRGAAQSRARSSSQSLNGAAPRQAAATQQRGSPAAGTPSPRACSRDSNTVGVGARRQKDKEEGPMAAPLLFVDVNISPGQAPEQIVLREGQSVEEVASEFAKRHGLAPSLRQRLQSLLTEVLQRREQQQQQQRVN